MSTETNADRNANTTWRIAPAGTLLSAEFDGQTVVYHTGIGHTHWVSPVAAAVLQTLRAGPQDRQALLTALTPLVDEADRPLLEESLDETLAHLTKLTLIEAP